MGSNKYWIVVSVSEKLLGSVNKGTENTANGFIEKPCIKKEINNEVQYSEIRVLTLSVPENFLVPIWL